MLDKFGYPIKRDPPLPPLLHPDPVTIHDLSPEDKARAIIKLKPSGATMWYLPEKD